MSLGCGLVPGEERCARRPPFPRGLGGEGSEAGLEVRRRRRATSLPTRDRGAARPAAPLRGSEGVGARAATTSHLAAAITLFPTPRHG